MRRLAVIPSDPIDTYMQKGMGVLLEEYYNPLRFFDEVYLLSPLEKERGRRFGMEVVPTGPGELAKRIKELKIDVVRAYGGYWPSDMAARGRIEDVPIVVSIHDTNPEILHDSVREADVVWCVSSAVRDVVIKRFGRPERTWIFSDRVGMDLMTPCSPEDCTDLVRKYPAKYRILHIGRKEPQKNLDTLIKALRFLGDEYFLLAVGRGNTAFYEDLATKEGVASRCSFVDLIENDEIRRYHAWSHCMCVPSRWEGFGIVFIEAMACRSIVVTSAIAPMNEYITDRQNGILVRDYEDPRAIAEAVRRACTDDKLRKEIKANARESIERFSTRRVMEKETSYYARILEMNAAGLFKRPLSETIALLCAKAAGSVSRISGKIGRRLKNFGV